MKNDEELKQEIFEFVDQIHRYSREDMRKAIFDFMILDRDDRAQSLPFTIKDLNELRCGTIKAAQELPCPAYIQLNVLDTPQRTAYCHLVAMIMFLRKRNLIKYLIETDTAEPFIFSIHEE